MHAPTRVRHCTKAGGTTPDLRCRRCHGWTPLDGAQLRSSGRTPPGSQNVCHSSSDHLLSLVAPKLPRWAALPLPPGAEPDVAARAVGLPADPGLGERVLDAPLDPGAPLVDGPGHGDVDPVRGGLVELEAIGAVTTRADQPDLPRLEAAALLPVRAAVGAGVVDLRELERLDGRRATHAVALLDHDLQRDARVRVALDPAAEPVRGGERGRRGAQERYDSNEEDDLELHA